MATKLEIRNYAQANGVSNAEARQHFINLARQSTSKVDESMFMDFLSGMADGILTCCPDHDYNQTPNSALAAKLAIDHYKFNINHYEQLILISDKFDNDIKVKYGASLITGIMAYGQDQQATLINANVPQKTRIMRGFFDTLISELGLRTGAINMQHIHIKA